MAKKKSSVAVIGSGNWGSSLVAALRKTGLGPLEIIGRAQWQQARPSLKLDARVIWLCVPDAAIASVTAQLAARRRNLRGQIVVHSSGALSAHVLEPARQAGARIASVHPVMSFPTRRRVNLSSVMFGIEAQDASVRRELSALVRRLGGVPFELQAQTRALYHAAGIMASPLLVSAITAAIETAELAGLNPPTATAWVRALAEATVANIFARGPHRSFSGPFARGDAETIRLHLLALAPHPILADLYRSLARHAIAALPVKNRPALEKAVASASGRRSRRAPG